MATATGHGTSCGLSGCGEEAGSALVSDAAAQVALDARARDRLWHMDEVSREGLEDGLAWRARQRRTFLRTGGLLGVFAFAGALLPRVPRAASADRSRWLLAAGGGGGGGKEHVVGCSPATTRLGQFDPTRDDVLLIDPGDVVVYKDTWSHFLGKLQPGVPIEELRELRLANPGKGPHSIIGPIGVNGAEPGDALEIQFLAVKPVAWAANFHNPGQLGTGALPDLFPEGQVRYFTLDLGAMRTRFSEGITLPLAPFQGTIGVAPPDGFLGVTNGPVSSVPPGPHGGNMDLREMGEGSRLFLPVWKPRARIFTGDSHALQGDGEVNLTALETAMKELRVRVLLHKKAGLSWPFVETETHWIALGMDKDLNAAFRVALVNAIDFLSKRAHLSRADAYALCSVAVSFRVTQVVDVNKGVHAMIPKSIFAPAVRSGISIV
ncbi:MAG TPA: acetamidase/formamidase family protein [Anaeromyxobacteraceae bacterium]